MSGLGFTLRRFVAHARYFGCQTTDGNQSTKDATKFYEAKVEELAGNLKGLEAIVQGKSKNLSVVEDGTSHLRRGGILLMGHSSPKREGPPGSSSLCVFICCLKILRRSSCYKITRQNDPETTYQKHQMTLASSSMQRKSPAKPRAIKKF